MAEQSAYILFYVRLAMKPIAALPVPAEPPPAPAASAAAGAKRAIGPQLPPDLAAKRLRSDDGSDSPRAAAAIGPAPPPQGWRPQNDGPSLFARNSTLAGSAALPGPLSVGGGAKASDGTVRIGRPAGPSLLRITLKPRTVPAAAANGTSNGAPGSGSMVAAVTPQQEQQQQKEQQDQQEQAQQAWRRRQQRVQEQQQPLPPFNPASATPADIREQVLASVRGDAKIFAAMHSAAEAAVAEGRPLSVGTGQLPPSQASAIKRGVGAVAAAKTLELVQAAVAAGSPAFAELRARVEAAVRAEMASGSR